MKWIQIKPIKPEFLFDLSIWNNKKIGQNRVDVKLKRKLIHQTEDYSVKF